MTRKNIPTNIVRKLWGQCGGFCQNPNCNKYLFTTVDTQSVSLANVAHIIGRGKNGPRSEHEFANYIDKDGLSNLIMLCLECHKIVDELEHKFSVKQLQKWKHNHTKSIRTLFQTPNIRNERVLLEKVNDLLYENKIIFDEYGPYSARALSPYSEDVKTIWQRKSLDTIIPNNQKIIDLIEYNKGNFDYPWDVYRQMTNYKLHADSFRDNCLLSKKVNDYKLFPKSFDDFIKNKLNLPVEPREYREKEEIEYRRHAVQSLIEEFLADHKCVQSMEKLNKAMFDISLKNGRNLRVFVTNTYFFTEYTLDKILTIDPAIDAIICANPYGSYTREAKTTCIEEGIGLFRLNSFMGAIWKEGKDFLNSLLRQEINDRKRDIRFLLKPVKIPAGCRIFIFGSYLRREIYNDIDMIFTYPKSLDKVSVKVATRHIENIFKERFLNLDLTVCSNQEFLNFNFEDNNCIEIKMKNYMN